MDAQQQNIFLIIAILITLYYFYQGYILYFTSTITSAAQSIVPRFDFIYV